MEIVSTLIRVNNIEIKKTDNNNRITIKTLKVDDSYIYLQAETNIRIFSDKITLEEVIKKAEENVWIRINCR